MQIANFGGLIARMIGAEISFRNSLAVLVVLKGVGHQYKRRRVIRKKTRLYFVSIAVFTEIDWEGQVTTATWEIFGQVAGIGGLALGVFLLLFREIIRKNIFPQMNRADGYRLMRLITLCVWSVAIVGMGTWLGTKWLDNTAVKQSTIGFGAPAIANTDGNVTVINGSDKVAGQ
ncbi:hypothetical protein ACC862_24320 [Rhizobium ruizarguesonis]